MGTNTNGSAAYPEPQWYAEFRSAYASAQAFILHGNVSDYVVPGVRLSAYLAKRLESRDVICFFDRAHGVTFGSPQMEAKAKKELKLDAPVDPALAALGLATGGGQGDVFPKAPSAALPLLEELLKSSLSVALIINFAEHICPAQDTATMAAEDRQAQIILRTWGTDKVIKERGNVVFLVTELLSDLSPAVRAASSCWKAINIPLPAQTEREQFISAYLKAWELPMEMTAPELGRGTAGLALVHLENIFLQADATGKLTWPLVRMAKADIIRGEYAGLLTIMEPTYGFEAVGGMEPLKQWARDEVMRPVQDGRIQDVPQGALFVGPPGTGKSHFVRALAREVGFNAVALNLENIMSKWQGQSERDMARALGVVKALAPVLLFMDELDQSEGASRGQTSGSPSGKNIFNQILQFLSDPTNRGRVIFFGASNRPDLIDPALMRFGRIDAIIPVMLPSGIERESVARAAARSQGVEITGEACQALANGSERYSCADVTAVVTKARKAAGRVASKQIQVEHVRAALAAIRPATIRQAGFFEQVALDACNDLELLPAEYAARLRTAALESQVPTVSSDPLLTGPRRKREL